MIYYEVQCEACGEVFEVERRKPVSNARGKCGLCGGVARRVFISAPGVAFHGAGFHCNDYDGLGITVPDLKEHTRIRREQLQEGK